MTKVPIGKISPQSKIFRKLFLYLIEQWSPQLILIDSSPIIAGLFKLLEQFFDGKNKTFIKEIWISSIIILY